jgi:7-keto-8-aminopelargonate synthetase-like enzyme
MHETVIFAGNDYLGLASHQEVIRSLQEAAASCGISAGASRWSLGWTDRHEQLERQLAIFMRTQDACIFGAAYFGGVIYYGRMATLGYRVVFCDELVHSNQYLGMRAAGFEIRPFRHLDADDLRHQLAQHAGHPPIVATDGVYGISGEVAPIDEIAQLARQFDAELFIDDAHGFGAIGLAGRGVIDLCSSEPAAVTVLGSMSKALGTNGGFLVGRHDLVDRFRRSPEASGSAIPPPPIAAAALTALRIVREQPALRQSALANANRMREVLQARGISSVDHRHPIVGMLLSNEAEAAGLSRHFVSRGLRIPYFKYASEPRENLLRAVGRAVYTEEHLARFAEAVATWNA